MERSEPQSVHSEGHTQAGSRLDAEGIEGAGDSHPGAAYRVTEGVEGKANGCALLFPASGCNPKTNFLYDLKAVAERARLRQDEFRLHKFRSRRSQRWHLWSGVDLRTVQQWLGHSDMKSTDTRDLSRPGKRRRTIEKRQNATFA